MSFFKRNDSGAPPDVGREEEYDAGHKSSSSPKSEDNFSKISIPALKSSTGKATSSSGGTNIEIEKINVKIESVISWINQFYERFSSVSENIGELRAMNLSNEKKISESMKDAVRAIDVVKEVKPENLRMDYQKIEMKINSIDEKIVVNKQFMDDIMKEVKGIKKKAEMFIGIEGLLKLNDEVKQDLVGIQRISSKVRMHSDKVEDIFMELRSKFSEIEKTIDIVSNLDSNYSSVKKDIDKLQLSDGNFLKNEEFSKFKKDFDSKFAAVKNDINDLTKIKNKEIKVEELVEMALSIGKKNEDDISDIYFKLKKGISSDGKDYESKLSKVLELIDRLTDKVNILENNQKNMVNSASSKSDSSTSLSEYK